jgi:hypothetical protein
MSFFAQGLTFTALAGVDLTALADAIDDARTRAELDYYGQYDVLAHLHVQRDRDRERQELTFGVAHDGRYVAFAGLRADSATGKLKPMIHMAPDSRDSGLVTLIVEALKSVAAGAGQSLYSTTPIEHADRQAAAIARRWFARPAYEAWAAQRDARAT